MKKIYSLSIALISVTFIMGLTSCRGGGGAKGAAAAAAGRAAMQIVEEFDDDESSGSGSSNVNFKRGKRVTLTNRPCDVCDCIVYTGWYKGYYTDCDCGHAYGVH